MDYSGLRWHAFSLVTFVALIAMSSVGNQAMAKDGGQFEGAVWKFTMTPKLKKLKTLHGRFRVSKDVFFQRKNLSDPKFSKNVGKNHPNGKRTRAEFTDLRAVTANKKLISGIKGTARLSIDSRGEWSGIFIGERGRNWEFKCSRVKE